MPSRSRLFQLARSVAVLLLIATATAGVDNNDDDVALSDGENSNDPRESAAMAGSSSERDGGSSSQSSSMRGGAASPSLADPTLNSNSVVLITGAAGFIGSELALALRRTYGVRKLLLVDNLGIDSENESAYVPPPPKEAAKNRMSGGKAIYEVMSEEEMSHFEMKRQRAFRIFHELTAPDLGGGARGAEGVGGAESIRFYRADMRPSIPEFFDFGEVPLLEGIFQSHPDITHVVHLADVPLSAQNQAIPRNKDSVKTGRMEGVLEEMRLMIERGAASSSDNAQVRLPQFVYASSHEVYDNISAAENKKTAAVKQHQPNPPPFREDAPITTPSSLHGTAKLIDEVLASAYHSTHGIYSVGMRFFDVYGPWSSAGTQVFEAAASVSDGGDNAGVWDEDVNDYVYIDDAVDALMSAMQYRPPGADPPPVVFNVGTGKGSTLGELRKDMAKHFPKPKSSSAKPDPSFEGRMATKSIASTSRSESLLGFRAQVSLEEGLAHTLTWHRGRSFPYGPDPNIEESVENRRVDTKIAESLAKSRRVAEEEAGGEKEDGEQEECSPLDVECLRGALAFPCASECHQSERCTPSAWDDVAPLSKAVTSGCNAVLFTILLDDGAEQIPSAVATASADGDSVDSLSYVGAGLPEDEGRRTQARCNIAFVSERSPLVRRLKSEGEEYVDAEESNGVDSAGLPPLLRHGFWTVLPVSTPLALFGGKFALEYLPKLSPGRFFGSTVRYAAYAAPSIVLDNLPVLLKRMEDGLSGRGHTALMLASKRSECDAAQRGSSCVDTYVRPPQNDMIQSRAYNMVRVALRGDIMGGGLEPVLDSSFVVHSLREEDSRLFRCDVYHEAFQWGASGDERALEFIISLHDLWSRAVVHWSTEGDKPWWTNASSGGGASTEGMGGKTDDGKNNNEQERKNSRQLEKEEQSSDGAGGGTWMGVLTSTEDQLLTHIIPWEGMGIVQLDHH
eukprot:CAMPEP_0181102060 /NCGR_PEP_ID=MMETSP1071-20121207/14103_1 /TAXON_ID=35127 /ORGANISM="Thalassiosira sp., Strain NH16" /LENGTH=962 /DNA_ID=CAMNT_0023184987 /DNA_START=79 /DNA_END=2967 /DNA_ORIENTATION=-